MNRLCVCSLPKQDLQVSVPVFAFHTWGKEQAAIIPTADILGGRVHACVRVLSVATVVGVGVGVVRCVVLRCLWCAHSGFSGCVFFPPHDTYDTCQFCFSRGTTAVLLSNYAKFALRVYITFAGRCHHFFAVNNDLPGCQECQECQEFKDREGCFILCYRE